MGLLDRWTKKKKKEQLEKVEEAAQVKILKKIEKKEEIKEEPALVSEVAAVNKEQVKKEKKVKQAEVKVEKKSTKQVAASGSKAWKLLIKPLVSEKAADLEAKGIYTFVVSKGANKTEIKKVIKDVYKVTPKKIRIANYEGKKVRFGRYQGRRSDWKKALVFLKKDERINIHEGI